MLELCASLQQIIFLPVSLPDPFFQRKNLIASSDPRHSAFLHRLSQTAQIRTATPERDGERRAKRKVEEMQTESRVGMVVGGKATSASAFVDGGARRYSTAQQP